jgi:hypothetical protein
MFIKSITNLGLNWMQIKNAGRKFIMKEQGGVSTTVLAMVIATLPPTVNYGL